MSDDDFHGGQFQPGDRVRVVSYGSYGTKAGDIIGCVGTVERLSLYVGVRMGSPPVGYLIDGNDLMSFMACELERVDS